MHTRVVFFDPSLAVGHEFAAREPHAIPGISESARSRVIDRGTFQSFVTLILARLHGPLGFATGL